MARCTWARKGVGDRRAAAIMEANADRTLHARGVAMPATRDLIAQAMSLPVEDRALVVDSLLRSLNPPDSDIDRKWAAVATPTKRR